jgi:predicted nucleic acid-binding protein
MFAGPLTILRNVSFEQRRTNELWISLQRFRILMIPTLSATRCGHWGLVFLVDTSVFTRVGRPTVRATLDELAPSGLSYSPLTGLELRFSASNETEWDRFTEALGAYERVLVDPQDFDRADEVQRMLARDGLKGRKPVDLLIAAQAERLQVAVLHYDRDFELIAGVTNQPHKWVVPRGTID